MFKPNIDRLFSEWIAIVSLSFMLLRGGLDQSSTNFLSPIIHLATYQFIKLDAFPLMSSRVQNPKQNDLSPNNSCTFQRGLRLGLTIKFRIQFLANSHRGQHFKKDVHNLWSSRRLARIQQRYRKSIMRISGWSRIFREKWATKNLRKKLRKNGKNRPKMT